MQENVGVTKAKKMTVVTIATKIITITSMVVYKRKTVHPGLSKGKECSQHLVLRRKA